MDSSKTPHAVLGIINEDDREFHTTTAKQAKILEKIREEADLGKSPSENQRIVHAQDNETFGAINAAIMASKRAELQLAS